MRTSPALLIGFSMFILSLATGIGCQSQAPSAPAASSQPEYLPTATVKDLMIW